MIHFQYNDGGREKSGFKGTTGDCVVRAVAIATGLPYQDVYNDLYELQKEFSRGRSAAAKRAAKNPSPRNGVMRQVYDQYLKRLGWVWVPTMSIGSGCQTHLRTDELPSDRKIIVRLSKHVAAICWGTLNDTYDCSREGTRCVYGYYHQGEA